MLGINQQRGKRHQKVSLKYSDLNKKEVLIEGDIKVIIQQGI